MESSEHVRNSPRKYTFRQIENDDAEMHLEEFAVTVAIVAAST
jgi:hypothetical protein